MDKEHPHTLAKIAALQARCDRLEKGLMAALTYMHDKHGPLSLIQLCEIDKIIKGE